MLPQSSFLEGRTEVIYLATGIAGLEKADSLATLALHCQKLRQVRGHGMAKNLSHGIVRTVRIANLLL